MFKKIFIFMFIGFISMTSVQANSSQKWFKGVDSSGVIMTGEISPIVVKHEKLIFDIQDFPQTYYHDDKNSYLAYSASVSAQYEFYNPTDYTIEARLMFPFGNIADYGYFYDDNHNRIIDIDNEKYKVTVNDQEIKRTIRHTFHYPYQDFSLEEDLPLLIDGYKEDSFYKRNLPVTKYTYSIKNVDKSFTSAFASFTYKDMSSNIKFYNENLNGYSIEENQIKVGVFLDRIDKITLYVIGEELKQDLLWNVYENAGQEKEISGEINLVSKTKMNFEDFAMLYYKEDSGILESDWYNAVIDMLNQSSQSQIISNEIDLSGDLLRWYDYTIDLKPKESITNTVIAPMYPSIDTNYEPPIYEYTYLLSPARTWKEFGSLDIEIHTPYKMINHNLGEYEITENGYTLSLETLPLEELEFSLSTIENPSEVIETPYFVKFSLYYIIFPVAVIVGFIMLLKLGSRKKE